MKLSIEIEASKALEMITTSNITTKAIVNLDKQVMVGCAWLDYALSHARVKGGRSETQTSIPIICKAKCSWYDGFASPA